MCQKLNKEFYGAVHSALSRAQKFTNEVTHENLVRDLCAIAENGAQKEIKKYTAYWRGPPRAEVTFFAGFLDPPTLLKKAKKAASIIIVRKKARKQAKHQRIKITYIWIFEQLSMHNGE